MVNESPKKKIYDALRKMVSRRLIQAMDITEADIGTLSLGELINTLFLMHGDWGSLGNYHVSFGAILKMVGADLLWQEPAEKPTIPEPVRQRVQ